jgi:hypothetical protein
LKRTGAGRTRSSAPRVVGERWDVDSIPMHFRYFGSIFLLYDSFRFREARLGSPLGFSSIASRSLLCVGLYIFRKDIPLLFVSNP